MLNCIAERDSVKIQRRREMKKKILLFIALLSVLCCVFALSASAQTPSSYIVFKVKVSNANEYVTAYTKDVFPTDSKFDFNEPFYSDVDFTQEISKDSIEGIDLSDAYSVNGNSFIKIRCIVKEPLCKL